VRGVSRLLERPRLGFAVMVAPMIVYLTIGGVLALFVDRRFLINEILAFVFYAALVTVVILLERSQESSDRPVEEKRRGKRLRR
jgi:hypothetical protein